MQTLTHKENIFSHLKEEHNKHRLLLRKIEATKGDSAERRSLFKEFALEAKGHATAEEQAFYSTLLAIPSLTEKARHSTAEHKEVEDLINELAETDMSTASWLTQFKFLKQRYEHHIDEEENEVFPAAQEHLSEVQEVEMELIFSQRKPVEKENATVGES